MLLYAYLSRSLGFLESFSDSILSIFGHRYHGPASSLAITRTIWSEWTQPDGPLELSLVFECIWPLLMQYGIPAWPAWLFQELSVLSGLYPGSPSRPSCNFPLEILFRTVYVYCILHIYCILVTFYHILFFKDSFWFVRIFCSTVSTIDYCQLSSLFNYCS